MIFLFQENKYLMANSLKYFSWGLYIGHDENLFVFSPMLIFIQFLSLKRGIILLGMTSCINIMNK